MSNNSALYLKIEWAKNNLIKGLDYIIIDEYYADNHERPNLDEINDYLIHKITYTPLQGDVGTDFLKELIATDNIIGDSIKSMDVFAKDWIAKSKVGIECIKADNMIDDDYVYAINAYIVENMKSKINQYLSNTPRDSY